MKQETSSPGRDDGRGGANLNLAGAPLISIVTVVFNGAQTIRATLESAISQLSASMEYIVIDGGSKDATVDIIRQYQDKLAYWVSEPDRGIYDAMNKASWQARGTYLFFLNSGDLFVSNQVLMRAAGLLESRPDVLIGRVNVMGGSGDVTMFPCGFSENHDARSAFKSHLCHQACFVSREKLLECGGFDMRFPHFADFHSTWRVARTGTVRYAPELIVADFNLEGVSSDWRRAVPLYLEREKLLADLGAGGSSVFWLIGLVKAFSYRMKKWISAAS